MFQRIKNVSRFIMDWVFARFGYFRPEIVNATIHNLAINLDEMRQELDGVLFGVAEMNRRHNDSMLIMTGLMKSTGLEETILKLDFLQELYNRGYTVSADNTKEGDVLIKVIYLGNEDKDNGCCNEKHADCGEQV